MQRAFRSWLPRVKLLARAGRHEEARKVVELAATSAEHAYNTIRQDETRTVDYQKAQLQRVYEGVKEQVAIKLAAMASGVKDTERRDSAAAFGVAGLSGDAASLIISQRDASDRVAAAGKRRELRELLERANRTGDEVLARAVAQKAFDNRDADTLNLFLEDRKHLDATVQRLWDAASSNDLVSGFNDTMSLLALRPRELA